MAVGTGQEGPLAWGALQLLAACLPGLFPWPFAQHLMHVSRVGAGAQDKREAPGVMLLLGGHAHLCLSTSGVLCPDSLAPRQKGLTSGPFGTRGAVSLGLPGYGEGPGGGAAAASHPAHCPQGSGWPWLPP